MDTGDDGGATRKPRRHSEEGPADGFWLAQRGQHKPVRLAIDGAEADDLAKVIDAIDGGQFPTRARIVKQRLHIKHATVAPDHQPPGTDIPGSRFARSAPTQGMA